MSNKQRYVTLDEVMQPQGMILVKEPKRKTGNGKAATKTLTQMVKEAAEAKEEAKRHSFTAENSARMAQETEERMGHVLKSAIWFISAMFCLNFLPWFVWLLWRLFK